ncbi:MAG: sensor histidine kinase [Actinomycetota bacterium]|nr:sensor histidine kinase [Actinomycetota bacterium]
MTLGGLVRYVPRIAMAAFAVNCVSFFAALVLEGVNASASDNGGGWYAVPFVLVLLTIPAVGALLVSRRPGNAVGWLALGASTCEGVGLLAHAWAVHALRVSDTHQPGGAAAAWIATWLMVPALGLLPFLLAVFPGGSPVRWLRWPVRLGALLLVVATVAQAVAPDELDGVNRSVAPIRNPLGVEVLRGPVGHVTTVAAMYLALLALAALGSLVGRALRAGPNERRPLLLLVLSLALLPLGAVMGGMGGALGNAAAADAVMNGTQLLAIVGSAAALAMGVLVDDLFELRDYARRLALGGVLSGLIIVGFVAVVSLVATVTTSSGAAPPAVAAALVAIVLGPLRGRLQRAVDRLLYGWRSEPYRVLSELGLRLEATATVEGALPAVVETVTDGLRLPYARIDLDAGAEGLVTVAEAGVLVHHVLRLPLAEGTRPLGELVVGLRSAEEPFTPDELALLRNLARSASTAAQAGLLTTELRAARARLVRSREDERRRLQRELHDGVGPALAGLGLQLDSALDSVSSDPTRTAELLTAMQHSLRTTAKEVRRIAHDLRPGVLDELGLLEAVREQARLLTANVPEPLALSLELSAVVEVSAAVEVAVYRIASEALTNVVRHAQASRCSVRLCVNGQVELDITDDGVGLSGRPAEGLGLRSMADRVAELGGTFVVCSAQPTGTRVEVRLPVRP